METHPFQAADLILLAILVAVTLAGLIGVIVFVFTRRD